MKLIVLHLSDIHIRTNDDPILGAAQKIVAACREAPLAGNELLMLVTGDIAFSGKSDEYALAEKLLIDIKAELDAEYSFDSKIIVLPGNHDCDFGRNTKARSLVIESLDSETINDVDESIVSVCVDVQKNFWEFKKRIERTDFGDDQMLQIYRYMIGERSVSVCTLNVSWVSKIKEDPGALLFPAKKYEGMLQDHADVKLVALHHPPNWMSQIVYRPFRRFVRSMASIVFTGHEHEGNVGVIEESEANSAFVEGCVLQDGFGLTGSGFNLVEIDLVSNAFRSQQFLWGGGKYSLSEKGSWLEFHRLPQKTGSLPAISDGFLTYIDDPGGFFRHPAGQNLTLPDLFVYPDLLAFSDEFIDRKRESISAKSLLDDGALFGGVMLVAEEKAGATSLLFRLYRSMYEKGIVPIYVKGKELRRSVADEVDSVIRRAVALQYGEQQVSKILQLPKSKKVLFIDDFDDGPIKAIRQRISLLGHISDRFESFALTVGPLFEFREIMERSDGSAVSGLKHLEIQPFGYKRRSELIQRWYSLGVDGAEDDAAYIAKCDKADRIVNSVMSKAIVPSLPLYLLTLLQSIEAGASGDFQESSLGYYYQYLVTQAFTDSGARQDKLTELFQYVSQLAWYFHGQKTREVTEASLRKFNEQYSKDWNTVDFTLRIETLLASKVLYKVGDDYAFRYPYVYYFLKGKYLSENLKTDDVRAYIKHCCEHLYVRDYANTVLFLSHHTNEEFVVDTIADALVSVFRGADEITFDGDAVKVKALIADAPNLKYEGGSPVVHRQKRDEIRDQLEQNGDGLAEFEESDVTLSVMAKVTMLFKTAEILGQILKNQYSRIKRPRKDSLINTLFSAPLRALGDFYSFLENNRNTLVVEIEAAIDPKGDISLEDKKKIARRTVSQLVLLITFSFFHKTAQSVNSDNLLENIQEVVRNNDSMSFKLIHLAVLLDSPKPIPRALLKSLYHESKGDLIVERLIRVLVLNRLYMFKTSEQDMQWINSEVLIDLSAQHRITYGRRGGRLLK